MYVKTIQSQNFQKLIKYINRIRHIIPIKENLKKALTDIEYLSDHNKKIVWHRKFGVKILLKFITNNQQISGFAVCNNVYLQKSLQSPCITKQWYLNGPILLIFDGLNLK